MLPHWGSMLGLALRKSLTAAPNLDELFLRMDSDHATAAAGPAAAPVGKAQRSASRRISGSRTQPG
jgi:hypothetical protein